MLSNVSLEGAGWGATIIDLGTTDDYGINTTDKSNVRLSNFEIKSNTGGAVTKSLVYIKANSTDIYRIVVDTLFINGCDDYGIRCTSAGGYVNYPVWIKNCMIYNPDQSGITLSTVRYSLILLNYIELTGLYGIYTSSFSSGVVNSNNIHDTTSYGMNIYSASYSSFTGNVIRTTGDRGIYIGGSSNENVICSNRIKDWTTRAIDDGGTNNLIKDNNALV